MTWVTDVTPEHRPNDTIPEAAGRPGRDSRRDSD